METDNMDGYHIRKTPAGQFCMVFDGPTVELQDKIEFLRDIFGRITAR